MQIENPIDRLEFLILLRTVRESQVDEGGGRGEEKPVVWDRSGGRRREAAGALDL